MQGKESRNFNSRATLLNECVARSLLLVSLAAFGVVAGGIGKEYPAGLSNPQDLGAAAYRRHTEQGLSVPPVERAADALPAATQPGGIPPVFFGLDINQPSTPWPQVPFGTLRLWDDHTPWDQLELERNRYDWRILDSWVGRAMEHGVDLLYTIGHTPPWAAANPDQRCGPARHGGRCSPPSDLSTERPCQGPLSGVTTTNCQFKEFVTSLLDHVCTGRAPNKNCKVKNYSCWNESNNDGFWGGTASQMAQMCSDMVSMVKEECRSCTTLTPEVAAAADVGTKANGESRSHTVWMEGFLRAYAKYGNYPDGAAYHPYAGRLWALVNPPFPESFAGSGCNGGGGGEDCPQTLFEKISTFRSVLDQNGMAGKPIWATEGGWGGNQQLSDPDLKAAYVARWYILQASEGVARAIWYAWDQGGNPRGTGGLWSREDGINKAGIACGQVYRWLLGARFTHPCSARGSIWTCALSRPGGYQGEIVWDTANSYRPEAKTPYRANPHFKLYRDLEGNSHSISGGSVMVGTQPLLLENQPALEGQP